MTGATVTSSVTTDGLSWLLVPHPRDVDEAWRAATLDLFEAVGRLDHPDGGQGLTVIDASAALDVLLELRGSLGSGQQLLAALVVPGHWPLPVVVTVGLSEGGDAALLELAGASGGLPVEPPSIDELPDHLAGAGPVVVRYDLDDLGAIWGTVCAVRRLDGVDTHVLWRTPDLALVPTFAPFVVEVLAAVENEVDA